MTINPNNPFGVSAPPGTAPISESGGRGGEVYSLYTHGKYYVGSYYGRSYSFNRTAVTLPVIAGSLASVFSLYNPPASTVNLEIQDIDVGIVLATTVVDVVGVYWQPPVTAVLGTLGTIAVFGTDWFSGQLGGNAGQGNPYRSFTHSGTPVRVDIVGFFGATTTTAAAPMHKDYDGKMVLPVGHVISVAMSTGASTSSGVDVGIRWLETNVS